MTIISNPVTGPVLGQPMSPSFGVQFAGTPPANTVVAPVPLSGVGQPQKSVLESCARGELPRNALVSSVAGVSCGAQNATPVDDLLGNGAGAQLNLGVAVNPNAGNPVAVTTDGINTQNYVGGNALSNDTLSNGPVASNIETLTSAPVSGATTIGNISLNGGYQG